MAYQSLYLSIFFLSNKNSVTDFSAPIEARVFKFCIHFEGGLVYCVKENQDTNVYFAFFFQFFFFFYLSLLCNACGHLPSMISQQLLD